MESTDTGLRRDQREQRELLARDLHDLTIKRLSWLSFELAAVATSLPSSQVPTLIQAISEVDVIIGDLRQFVLGSFERGPTGHGLEPTLTYLTEYAEVRTGSAPQVRVDGDHAGLPPAVATHVRAVLAEAVHNAVEHGRASNLEVDVQVTTEQVEVRVADDGQGPPQVPVHGLGLGSMAARARELDGTFVFRPRSPRGAVVEWCVPLPAADSPREGADGAHRG